MNLNLEHVILLVQFGQLAGILFGLVKIGRWIGSVDARLEQNDIDHRRYDRRLERTASGAD